MAVFELVIFLLFAGALLAAVARRTRVPYPALLALAGATLALLPGTPSVTLDPELALALFVAPVLLDAAFDSSPRDLKENWRAVTSLALTTVRPTATRARLVVATRSERELAGGDQSGPRRRGPDGGDGGPGGPLAGAGPALGGGHRPGGHRGPARRRGGHGGAQAAAPAPPPAGHPRGREPVQRRQRPAGLSIGGGGGGQHRL